MDEELREEIEAWLKDYDDNEEHDLDLTIALKDDAACIFRQMLEVCECKSQNNSKGLKGYSKQGPSK